MRHQRRAAKNIKLCHPGIAVHPTLAPPYSQSRKLNFIAGASGIREATDERGRKHKTIVTITIAMYYHYYFYYYYCHYCFV